MARMENVIISDEEIKKQSDIMNEIKNTVLNDNKKHYAYVETYGCAQNVNDGERIMGMLCSMGYEKCNDKEIADVIIYNTCAVRENAELRVFGNLGALKILKRKNPNLIVGVCGCMMQQEHIVKKIKSSFSHVDIVFGTHALYMFPEIMKKVIEKRERVICVFDSDGKIFENLPICREKSVSAGVSVMYGCNNFCTYCIVPYVRGRERSRKVPDIINEVKQLAKNNVKEIMLLGQNVNSYGKDFENPVSFASLLNEVSKVDGIERIRFMTSHPKDLSDELINVMADNKKICKQLHLPIQSGSDKILKLMNRHYTVDEYIEKIEKVRRKIPDITLTTDIIVGFPGEDNDDFKKTLEVLKKVRYDVIFSFIYSKRKGTPASKMEDVLTKEQKKANFDEMLSVQNEISFDINKKYEGKIYDILVEKISKTDKEYLTGRTDGGKLVHVKGNVDLIGKTVNVKITKAHTWSLFGEIIKGE